MNARIRVFRLSRPAPGPNARRSVHALASARGVTLVEMVCAIVVLAILTTIAMPLAQNAVKRRKEAELHRALDVMCAAIDRYHRYALAGSIQPWDPDWMFYPPDLDTLVEGVELSGAEAGKVQVERFLREIPEDPITGDRSWGLRSYQMDSTDTSWDGENVFDVFSLSAGVALDGSSYADWGCTSGPVGVPGNLFMTK